MTEFEPVPSDPALAGALNTLFMAAILQTADHVPGNPARASVTPSGVDFFRHQRRLHELVVLRAGGGPGSASDKELRRASAFVSKCLDEALEAPNGKSAMIEQAKIGAPYAITTLTKMLNHEAWERQQVELRLEFVEGSDGFIVLVKRLTMEASCLSLLDFIHARLQNMVQEAPLFALERAACRWFYDQESPSAECPPERRSARTTREREWSLTERKSFASGMTMLETAFATGRLNSLPPVSRRMAESARRSRLGVFVVREQSASGATLEDVALRERVTMREHEPGRTMAPGTVIVGRLYPWDDGVYLRSPGAWVLEQASVPPPEKLLEWTDNLLQEKFSLAMALETVMRLVTLKSAPDLRRDVPPASSRDEARKKLDAFRSAMDETGMFRNPDSRDALWLEPGDEHGCWTIFGWEADLPLGAWVEKLMEVAGIAREVRNGPS